MFNVNSRDKATEVYLEEGKVKLEIGGNNVQTVEMAPGDLVSYSRSNQQLSKAQKVDALENTSWKDGTPRLQRCPL